PDGPDDLRAAVQERLGHLDLVARLDRIRLEKAILVEWNYDWAKADPAYAEAFREAGLGGVGGDAEEVAQRICALPVGEQVVAALDDWAVSIREEEKDKLAWLLGVAWRADRQGPWRQRFRDPGVWRSRAALERLAAEAKVAELSPSLLTALEQQLSATGG